jgi:hypothetical protein
VVARVVDAADEAVLGTHPGLLVVLPEPDPEMSKLNRPVALRKPPCDDTSTPAAEEFPFRDEMVTADPICVQDEQSRE